MLKESIPPLHPEGWRFIPLFALAALILFWIWTPLGWLGVLATCWCAYFFRNPHRVTPVGDSLVISPADGLVQSIAPAPPPDELEMGDAPLTRISVFMIVFNVHVNRAPCLGVVGRKVHKPGRFFNASLDKASVFNERLSLKIDLADGRSLASVQIAGLVARRIRCDVEVGDALEAGQVFGLIRFGSRVDVYLPAGVNPLVVEGQTAIAGETVLADLAGTQPSRQGARR